MIFPGALLPGEFPPGAIFSGAIFLQWRFSQGRFFYRGDFPGAIFPGRFSGGDFPRLVIIGVRLVDNLAYTISNRYTFDLDGIMRRVSIATPTQNRIPLSWYFHR